ncbi:MAG: ABC transporter permease [Rhodobacteraceae bacterium]|nr:ABC transporter permease [Paracoccaceae bacterium]
MTQSRPTGPQPQARRKPVIGLKAARSVFALMLREMATTYGRSPGGYLWAVGDPIAGVILLTVVFSLAFDAPPLGSNFPLFYATGFLPFMAYGELTMKIGQAIRYSRPLLTYPTVTFVDAILSRLLLNLLTELVVFAIVITGIALLYGLRMDIDAGRLLHALAMLTVLVLGLGTFNCYMFGAYPVWERVWGILNKPLFFLSGVFFVVDSLPASFRDLMLLNPLTHVIAEVRAGFYPTYDARYISPVFVYATGLVFLFLGMLLLYRHHRFLITEGA